MIDSGPYGGHAMPKASCNLFRGRIGLKTIGLVYHEASIRIIKGPYQMAEDIVPEDTVLVDAGSATQLIQRPHIDKRMTEHQAGPESERFHPIELGLND